MSFDQHNRGPATKPIAWPLSRDPASVLRHRQLGEYVCHPFGGSGLWAHFRALPDGRRFRVTGRSLHPTDVQIRLWKEIDLRLPQLTSAAMESINAPSIEPLPREFSREEVDLSEVRMEENGDVELFFGSPLGDEIDAWPCVIIRDWTVARSHWTA